METDFRDLANSIARSEAARLAVAPLHYVRWDEPSRTSTSLRKTFCGRWVSPRATDLTAANVTCPDCRTALRLADAGSDDPIDVFGEAPETFPVIPDRFDVLAGYKPRGSR